MTEPNATLPFTVPDLYAGFAKGQGLAKLTPAELILEFVIRDSLLEIFKTGVKEVRFPRSEIARVKLKMGWFRARVLIQLKSMKWLAELPGCGSAEITLHVARKDRKQAEDFVRQVGCE